MINIARILEYFPIGYHLWSDVCGYCTLSCVEGNMIMVWPEKLMEDEHTDDNLVVFNEEGRYLNGKDCQLWNVDNDGYRQQNWKELERNNPYKKQIKSNSEEEDKLSHTYVVVSDDKETGFCMAHYLGNGKARKIADPNSKCDWKYIIPYEKYQSDEIEKCLTYNLAKNE